MCKLQDVNEEMRRFWFFRKVCQSWIRVLAEKISFMWYSEDFRDCLLMLSVTLMNNKLGGDYYKCNCSKFSGKYMKFYFLSSKVCLSTEECVALHLERYILEVLLKSFSSDYFLRWLTFIVSDKAVSVINSCWVVF